MAPVRLTSTDSASTAFEIHHLCCMIVDVLGVHLLLLFCFSSRFPITRCTCGVNLKDEKGLKRYNLTGKEAVALKSSTFE